MTDMAGYREKTQVISQEYFREDFPAATLMEVKSLARPELMVEMEAVAAVVSGNFVACLPLESMRPEDPLLAYRLNGWTISGEDGGPVRLASRNLPCYHQVKRVERLELVADDSVETSQAIALKRIARL